MLLEPAAHAQATAGTIRVRAALVAAMRDIFAITRARRAVHAVILTCSSYRTEHEGGRWKDVLFDDYIAGLPGVFKIERINNPLLFRRNQNAMVPSDATTSLLSLYSSFIIPRIPQKKEARRAAALLFEDLKVCPHLGALTVDAIARRLHSFACLRRLWCRLIRYLGARVVLCDDGYYQHDMIAGAKEAGAKVCELQHGIFIKGEVAYSWPAVATRYKEKMPIPDCFYIYGEAWRPLLTDSVFWRGRVQVIGSSRVDRYRNSRAARKSKGLVCAILVTAQGLSRDRLAQFLIEFLKEVGTEITLELYIKMHPAYDDSKFEYSAFFRHDRRVRVVAASEEPSTFQLLSQVDLHASISSTCHYEAVALGVPTIVIALPTYEMMDPLVGMGHAHVAHSPSDMRHLVIKYKDVEVARDIGASYYAPDAVNNFRRAFAETTLTA